MWGGRDSEGMEWRQGVGKDKGAPAWESPLLWAFSELAGGTDEQTRGHYPGEAIYTRDWLPPVQLHSSDVGSQVT